MLILFYGLTTLFSQAAVSIATGCLVIRYGLFGKRVFEEWKKAKGTLLFATLALIIVFLLSETQARIFPLVYGSIPQPHPSIYGKCFLLIWPFLLAAIIRMQNISVPWLIDRWCLFASSLAFLGCFQFFTGFPRPQPIPGFEPFYHATLFLGHHLSVANIFIFPFFFLLFQRLSPAHILGLSALGLCLFGTFSRILWLSLAVVLPLAITSKQPTRKRQIVTLTLCGLLLVSALFLPFVQDRLISLIGTLDRVRLWEANWQFFLERPILGVGLRRPELLSKDYFEAFFPLEARFSGHAHNLFLEVLSSLGLVGMCGFSLWWLQIFKLLKGHIYQKPAICAFSVLLINGLTQVNLWESKVFHAFGFTLALLLASNHSNDSLKGRHPL